MHTMAYYTSQTGSRNKRYEMYGLEVVRFWFVHRIITPAVYDLVSTKINSPFGIKEYTKYISIA